MAERKGSIIYSTHLHLIRTQTQTNEPTRKLESGTSLSSDAQSRYWKSKLQTGIAFDDVQARASRKKFPGSVTRRRREEEDAKG